MRPSGWEVAQAWGVLLGRAALLGIGAVFSGLCAVTVYLWLF